MWLLLDIGNTRLKAVCYESGTFHDHQSISYQRSGIEESLSSLRYLKPDAIYVANVAGNAIEADVRAWSVACFGLLPHFLRSQASFMGLSNAYADPQKLGVDRWLAMIGGRQRYAGPACIVDCGSALTIDLISHDGRHLGGMILPGLAMQHQMLKTQLPQLPDEISAFDALPAWGSDTAECIEIGLVGGLCGVIEWAMRRAEASADGVRMIMTGGDAPRLATQLNIPYDYHEHLVLEGLVSMATHLEGGH